jgi:hypothetical protein
MTRPLKGADPAARHNPTAPLICKPDPRAGLSDESLCTTVLAIIINVIPAMPKRWSLAALRFIWLYFRTFERCPRYSLWQLATWVQAGFQSIKGLVVLGLPVPTALRWMAQTTVGNFYDCRINRNTESNTHNG